MVSTQRVTQKGTPSTSDPSQLVANFYASLAKTAKERHNTHNFRVKGPVELKDELVLPDGQKVGATCSITGLSFRATITVGQGKTYEKLSESCYLDLTYVNGDKESQILRVLPQLTLRNAPRTSKKVPAEAAA